MSNERSHAKQQPPTLTEIRERWPATVDIPAAGIAFGLGRSHSYELASRGEFPATVIKIASRYRVITASIICALSGDETEQDQMRLVE